MRPQQTRMILVRLKRPVRLPTSLLDAIREGGIEKVSAFEEDVPDEQGTKATPEAAEPGRPAG